MALGMSLPPAQQKQKHADKARHNRVLCWHIAEQTTTGNLCHHDWVVTTAFYSALHFVTGLVFPFNVNGKETGKKVPIENIRDLRGWKESQEQTPGIDARFKEHTLLVDQLKRHNPSSGRKYQELLNLSHDARYKLNRLTQRDGDDAKRLLSEIEGYIVPRLTEQGVSFTAPQANEPPLPGQTPVVIG